MPAMNDAHPPELARRVLREQVAAVHANAPAAYLADLLTAQSLGIVGDETFDIEGLDGEIKPQQDVTLAIHRANGETTRAQVLLRIDTPIEVDYYRHGGILPFVLRQLLAA